MDLYFNDILDICKKYNELGWHVQEQLDDVFNETSSLEDLNENALQEIVDFLTSVIELTGCDDIKDLKEEIEEYLKCQKN